MAIMNLSLGTMDMPTSPRRRTDHVTIIVNERQAKCPIQLLLINSPLLEHRARVASLEGRDFKIKVDQEIEGAFVLYLETGSCPIAFETLNLLTYTAFKYKMVSLLEECQDVYLSQLIPMNCLESLMFAESHGCEKLAKTSFAIAIENFEDIWKTPHFCHVGKSQLLRILLDPGLNVRSMDSVYSALDSWCAYEDNIRAKDRDDIARRFTHTIKQRNRRPSFRTVDDAKDKPANATPVPKRRKVSGASIKPEISSVEAHSRKMPRGTVVCVGHVNSQLEVICINFSNNDGQPTIKTYPIQESEGLNEDSAFCFNFEYLYACGGSDVPDASYRFDLETSMWLKQHKMFYNGRRNHMLSYLNDRVYALGGINVTTGRVFEYIDKYIVHGDKWVDAGKLREQVRSAPCVTHEQDIYIFGGIRSNGSISQVVQCYNPSSKKTRVAGQIPSELPISRAITDRNLVYLFGSTGEVFEFDPCTEEFEPLPRFNQVLRDFGAVIQNGHLFVFGGRTSHQVQRQKSATVYWLDLNNKQLGWRQSITLPQGISVISCSEPLLDIG